jgi:hypothetical protein
VGYEATTVEWNENTVRTKKEKYYSLFKWTLNYEYFNEETNQKKELELYFNHAIKGISHNIQQYTWRDEGEDVKI